MSFRLEKKIKGFTLVELIVVIAIFGIVASVSVLGYLGFIEKARLSNDEQLVSQINNLIKAEDTYTYGTSNDALDIQYILKEQGISEVKTQSKGNYIFFDNTNRKAVLASLTDTGINVVYGEDSSSNSTYSKLSTQSVNANFRVNNLETKATSETKKENGQFLDYIYAPESFIKGYTLITTESRDGFCQNIRNIRNGGGAQAIKEAKESITNSISSIKSKSNTTGTLIENMCDYCTFINDNQSQIIMDGTIKRDVSIMIFSANITEINDTAFENLDDFSICIVDLPSSVTSISEDAIDALAKTDAINNINITLNNEELINDIKTKVESKEDEQEKEKYENVINAFTKTEERNNVLDGVKIKFYNSIDNGAKTEYQNSIDKTVTININSDTVYFASKMDIAYLKEKSKNDPNLYFEGYYVNGVKIDESAGKYTFTKSDYSNGYPSELEVIAKWSSNKESPKFKSFAHRGPDWYSNVVLTYSDSIMLSLVNTDQFSELYSDVQAMYLGDLKGFGEYDNHVIYPVSNDYNLNSNLTIPKNITLWIPYSTNFNNLDTTSERKFAYFYCNNSYNPSYLNVQTYGCYYNNTKNSDNVVAKKFTISSKVRNSGTIRIGANIYSSGGANSGMISGEYGYINNNGILINENGMMYVMGILENSQDNNCISYGGTVYEEMNILDWAGGTNCAGARNGNVAPFNNWELRNIIGKIRFENDANYVASAFILTPKTKDFNVGKLNILGENSLFQLKTSSSFLEKEETNGILNITLNGEINDSQVTLNVSGYDVDLSEIPFPLSRININLNSNSELSLKSNKYKVLPGSAINVEENATLNIQTEFALYEKFVRTDCETNTTCKLQAYPTNLDGAYLNNSGLINISALASFSGDVKQNGGKITISNNSRLKTEFKEGYGYLDSKYDFKCSVETKLITGSYFDGTNYEYGINYTKIIVDNEEYLIKTINDLKTVDSSSIEIIY